MPQRLVAGSRHGWLGIAIALTTALVDQANKWWMIEVYRIGDKGLVPATPFLDLVFVLNRGISYGLFQLEGPNGQLVLAGIAVAVSLVLGVWMWRADRRLLVVALGLVIGGAAGNAVDRILLGGVADFYSLHAFGWRWYVFNLADVAIVAGAGLLLYESFWASRKTAANQG
ncbi:MAG: signal peptidase II [Rhizobiales bacterium]|nr:signal peptidase II [Hyphomicrobiales bacterium]